MAAGLVMLLGTSCQLGQSSPPEVALDNLACVRADLPQDYSTQASGSFSLGNLADLASDPAARRTELHASGVAGGYFSTWRQAVGEPPFPPAIDVICQVIRFNSADQAKAFVASLQPTLTSLEDSTITWVPRSSIGQVEEIATGQASLPAGARAFHLASANNETSVAVYAVFAATGPYVQTVWAGDSVDSATLAQAATIEAAIAGRAVSAGTPTSATP
ncbi:MAG TPA: hypothetical protein VIK11_12895 [Tepidiformaceae bacterium]